MSDTTETAKRMTASLLAWYDLHRRILPWRAAPGERPDIYHVWLSEIMLQQTTVATVKTYFQKFITRWPRIEDLADAPLDDVLTAWAGLGYYARARNMHKCAKLISSHHAGIFPPAPAELEKLPGIGPYTAGAISAIGYGKPAIVVDGNIERIITRLYRIGTLLPKAGQDIRTHMQKLTCSRRPGDFAQAMMDLGATICRPKNPRCLLCPLQKGCLASQAGNPHTYPVKPAKKKRPRRTGRVFHIQNSRGEIFLRRREEKGLLGGMMELPGTPWTETGEGEHEQAGQPPFPFEGDWKKSSRQVKHVFTHFELHLDVFTIRISHPGPAPSDGLFKGGQWVAPDAIATTALPTVMKKVLKVAAQP